MVEFKTWCLGLIGRAPMGGTASVVAIAGGAVGMLTVHSITIDPYDPMVGLWSALLIVGLIASAVVLVRGVVGVFALVFPVPYGVARGLLVRTPDTERIAKRIFDDLDHEAIKGRAATYKWETKWAAERGTIIGSGTSLRARLSLFVPAPDWTPQSEEFAREIEGWIHRYWHDRMQFWNTYASWERVKEGFERGPRLTPGTDSSRWRRFWLEQINLALRWLDEHPTDS